MVNGGNFHETMQQVDQAGPAQPRPFQFDSTTDAVKDQNQRAIQAARKGGTRNSSQTGQTPGEADSTMPPNPLVAVACGAGAATATQILDPSDGLELAEDLSSRSAIASAYRVRLKFQIIRCRYRINRPRRHGPTIRFCVP